MRYWIAFFVLAGLACLTGCGADAVSGVTIDKAFRPLIPPDTKALAGIDLDALKKTSLYQRHEKDLQIPLLENSSERLGLDPQRDLAEVLIAWNGARTIVLAHGRFKPAEIEQKLVSLGAPQTSYKGHRVFGDRRNSLALLNSGYAVEASIDDVKKTVDLEGSSAATVPEELSGRLHDVPKGDQIWIVSRGGLPFADLPMRSDIESALSNIVHFINGATVGVKADTGVHFQIDMACVSEQGARRVHDALRGAIGLGRLSTKDDQRELLQVYDAINVDQDKAQVHVRADYPGELTDKLFEQIGQMRRAIHR